MSTWVQTKELQKAYLAGIVDGEGCISLHDTGAINLAPRVAIGQKNWPFLEGIRQQFGGTLARGGSSGVWILNVTGKDSIKAFLNYVLPYLVIKRREAEIMLLICDQVPNAGKPATLQQKAIRRRLEDLLENASYDRNNNYTEALQ